MLAHLFLFHELGIRHIVDDVFTEDWGCQNRIDFFSIDILELGIQYELIALRAEIHGNFAAKKDESEDVAVL